MVLIYYAKRGGTCFGKKLVRWEQCSPGIYIAGIYLLACLLPLLCWKAMVRASYIYRHVTKIITSRLAIFQPEAAILIHRILSYSPV